MSAGDAAPKTAGDAAALRTALAAQEQALQQARVRLEAQSARLAAITRQVAELGEVLGEGEDGTRLATLPLYAALVGAVAGNAALFFAFVEYLTRFHEVMWNVAMTFAMVLGAGAYVVAHRRGAGGLARVGLRRFTLGCLVTASLGLLLAAASPWR